jgi:NAD-dependent dihydropyrimidine dehydrogenase PreA subunit
MTYVVTDICTKDFACVSECAVDAIKPAAEDEAAKAVSQVYINPDDCVDCGTCVTICAQNAIFAEDEVPADKADAVAKNKAYFNK